MNMIICIYFFFYNLETLFEDHTGTKYAYISGDPKSRQDADEYCLETYGSRLPSFHT